MISENKRKIVVHNLCMSLWWVICCAISFAVIFRIECIEYSIPKQMASTTQNINISVHVDHAPTAIVGLVGRKEYEQCARSLYFFLQVIFFSRILVSCIKQTNVWLCRLPQHHGSSLVIKASFMSPFLSWKIGEKPTPLKFYWRG